MLPVRTSDANPIERITGDRSARPAGELIASYRSQREPRNLLERAKDGFERTRRSHLYGHPLACLGALSAHLSRLTLRWGEKAKALEALVTQDGESWRKLGVGLGEAYAAQARHLDRDDLSLVLELDATRGPRFVMRERAYLPLLGQSPWLACVLGPGSIERQVQKRLRQLGVEGAEYAVEADLARPSASGRKLALDPLDAALLLDAQAVAARAEALHPQHAYLPVRRRTLPGDAQASNVFGLPVRAFLGLRGVAYKCPADPSDSVILERCKNRLIERGIADPRCVLEDLDGVQTLSMPSDHGRVLVAPYVYGDPAGKLSTKRIEYDPTDPERAPQMSVMLAQAARLAYEPEPSIEAHLKLWGFGEMKVLDVPETGAKAFVACDATRNTIVVSFCGTQLSQLADVMTDADIELVSAEEFGDGVVHRGFANQARSLLAHGLEDALDDFIAAAPSRPTICAAGHSLGAALADLLTCYLAKRSRDPVRVDWLRTFGKPKLGDDRLARSRDAVIRNLTIDDLTLVNHNDAVTFLAVGWPWTHGRGPIGYFDRFGELALGERHGHADQARCLTVELIQGGALQDHEANRYLAYVRKNQ